VSQSAFVEGRRSEARTVLPVSFICLYYTHRSSFPYISTPHPRRVAMSPWDKCDGITGDVQSHDQIQDRAKDRIGAKRSCQYLMPKSGMVGANMAYETHTILEYDDYTFVMKKVITNPDVPFGKSFECHVQTVFINLGNNNCKMISSVEAQFLGRPPMVAWKIRNAMYNGVTDFFVAKGEVICEHSFREREIGT